MGSFVLPKILSIIIIYLGKVKKALMQQCISLLAVLHPLPHDKRVPETTDFLHNLRVNLDENDTVWTTRGSYMLPRG